MIHYLIDVVLVTLIPVAYVVGLNRNRVIAKREIEQAIASITKKAKGEQA